MKLKMIGFAILASLFATASFAQKSPSPEVSQLYREITIADSLLFSAFNNCDTVSYRKYLNKDIEFYHDLGGLNVGADYEVRSIKEMCARDNNIRRELIKKTLEVHPIKGYGAVEIGVHTFYHTNKGQTQEKVSGTYKFIHIWQLEGGVWKLTRVISYGHDEMHND